MTGEGEEPLRADVSTIWVVVNLVCVLQAIGYVTRAVDWRIQRAVGIAIIGLAVPATWALVHLVRRQAGWRLYVGPIIFDTFVAMLFAMEYVFEVDWRSPEHPEALIPMLLAFFGGIVAMGAPMYRIDRRRWMVTAAAAAVLIASMAFAMARGVG